jgi:hypothetical protein
MQHADGQTNLQLYVYFIHFELMKTEMLSQDIYCKSAALVFMTFSTCCDVTWTTDEDLKNVIRTELKLVLRGSSLQEFCRI